jgi:hypothetical protein
MKIQLMKYCRAMVALVAIAAVFTVTSANAQESHWAKPDDATANALIEMERQWAVAGCTHNGIEKTILAEDFHGIAPSGAQYSKKEAVADAVAAKSTEKECVMYDVTVHFFGDSMAILYGSESALRVPAGGKPHRVKHTWTDTWLKRDGKWQIVAAQDMPSDMP